MAQFTKYTGTITGEASALITVLDAILVTGEGWTKPYTGVNKAAYLQAAGNGFYLRVDDSGPGAGTFKEARILGYETMSDVDTGTGLFPTAAQMANGLFCRKSASADATARTYVAFADDRTLYLFIATGDVASAYQGIGFGDFYSYVLSDGFRTFIIGNTTENSATTSQLATLSGTSLSNAVAGHYVARAYTGTGTALNNGCHTDHFKNGAVGVMAGSSTAFIAYPNPSDGGVFVAPVWIHDKDTAPVRSIRGEYRGLWNPCHDLDDLTNGDTFSGTGVLAGKTFEIIKIVRSVSTDGAVAIETSNSLLTN